MSINMQKAIALTKKKIKDGNIAESILEKVLINSIKEYQQKVNIGIQDSVTDLLQNFKKNIKKEIFNIADTWKPYNRDAFLFPQNCRFFFSNGEYDVVVIEERPQIRSVKCSGITPEARRYGLQIPYSIFIFLFRNSRFVETYNAWRKSPLISLEDMLYEPLLPNIHRDLAVCIGNGLKIKHDTICGIVENVIEYFWLSEFNSDLFRYKDKISIPKWEREPDYVDKFELKQIATLKDLIDETHHIPPNKVQHELSKNIDEFAELFFKKIMSFFQQKRFEKFYPKELVENMNDAVEFIVSEYNLVLSAIELEAPSQIEDIGWEKGGNFWTNE